MQYKISMTALKRDDNIVAVGILYMGDIRVRNLTLRKNKDGGLFLSMPGKDSGRTDANGRKIYEEIAHPVCKELREALNEAAVESYNSGHPVTLRDREDGKLLIQAEVFDRPFYNRVGKGQLLINDKFVIKNLFINKKEDGSLYVSLPNYKMKEKSKDGKDLYSEIISMGKTFRKEVCDALINEYRMEEAFNAQNRVTIQSRIEQAQKLVSEKLPNPISKAQTIQI